MLRMYLLGVPQFDPGPSAGKQRLSYKAQALLCYLAMTGRIHTRAALAALLWGEHGEEEARRNLRKVLQELRSQLEPYLAIDQHTVGMQSRIVCWVDALEFVGIDNESQHIDSDRLQTALALYRADFLDGFYVRDAPAFETWMLAERARLRELMLTRLSALGERYAAEGDLPGAIATIRRLLELEPWREDAHRRLMGWLEQSGQRNAALVQYDICCRVLAEELGVEPDAATRELHMHLLRPVVPTPSVPALPDPLVSVVDFMLIGRKAEWQTLRAAWTRTVQSGTEMVFVAGEAGIGKTRLAEELLLHVQRQGHIAVRARAYALEGRLAYAPLADWLRSPPLQASLARLDQVWLRELSHLLPELLFQHPDLTPPHPLTERWQQKRLFDALRHAFTTNSRPLLLLLDDLQWCDAETLAWLQYLVESAPQAPLLVVGTVRSDEVDEEHPLHQLRRALLRAGRLSTIDLVHLSAEDTSALGAEVREYALDSVAAASLYRATAGNPLYVVETVRAGEEFLAGGRDYGPHTRPPSAPKPGAGLPPKVFAVIEARLAQLSPGARTLAQVAATIGRAFTLPLLAEAGRVDEEIVVGGLDELWRRHIIHEQASARYDFTHDRIRDVVYATISPVKRAHLHRRVAQALEKLHAPDLDPLAGELGMHYQGAGIWKAAFVYFHQAAAVARNLYAHHEEVDYLQKAIATAENLPVDGKTTAPEIELWLELGSVQNLIHGWSSELAATALQKADELAARTGDLPYRCKALSRLTITAWNRGQWHKARELNALAVALAQELGDKNLVNDLSGGNGITLYHLGEFAEALATFRRHPSFSAEPVQLAHAWVTNELSASMCLRIVKCLWSLGFPDQALAYCRQLLAVRSLQVDLLLRATGLVFATIFYSFLHDTQPVQMLAEELTAVSMEYDHPFFAMQGQMLRGWALAQRGDVDSGLPLVRMGREDERRQGIRMYEPLSRSLLAETLALAGEWEEALDEVTEALAYAEECGNTFWNAHLHKLQGDYMLALSLSTDEAETCYQRAIAIAQQQGAKSLELRATTSLCRLWQAQGKTDEAYALLSDIYGWFTEGFDTADLREAKALLDMLNN